MDVQQHDLPPQQRRWQQQRGVEPDMQAAGMTGSGQHDDGAGVTGRQERPSLLAKQSGGGFYANQGVVLAVLVGVDGVEAQVPQDSRRIDQHPGQTEVVSASGVPQRGTEAEGETHHQLRPPSDPLGQGIQRHQQQRGHAQGLRQPIELQQNRKPHQQQNRQKHQRLPCPQCPRGQRPSGRPNHQPVDVAIPEIVHHAAGGAHNQAADTEQDDEPDGLRPRRGGEQNAPGPRQEQQPGADRPVQPSEQQVGPPGARHAGNPAARDDIGMCGHPCYCA